MNLLLINAVMLFVGKDTLLPHIQIYIILVLLSTRTIFKRGQCKREEERQTNCIEQKLGGLFLFFVVVLL